MKVRVRVRRERGRRRGRDFWRIRRERGGGGVDGGGDPPPLVDRRAVGGRVGDFDGVEFEAAEVREGFCELKFVRWDCNRVLGVSRLFNWYDINFD